MAFLFYSYKYRFFNPFSIGRYLLYQGSLDGRLFFLLLFVEYLAWFIGWNYALLYQLAALTVVVNWSKYVVHFINLFSNYNVTKSIVQAHWAWNETALSFYSTGQVINLPAIAITIAITLLLIWGIRPTAMVNLVLVIIKIIILLIFIFACCKYVDLNNYKPFFPKNEGK
jgi:APA family basic amino acid/polyamine antiporter